MGCDIHFYIEGLSGDGTWRSLDTWTPEADAPMMYVRNEDSFYNGRNYSLFSALAGVRNGVGFAGIPTGLPIKPISEPRGLPENLSKEVRAAAKRWLDYDGHSFSWFTLKEFEDYDWNQEITLTGVLFESDYLSLINQKVMPKVWSGDSWGSQIIVIPESVYQELTEEQLQDDEFLVENFQRRPMKSLYNPKRPLQIKVKANWKDSLCNRCGYFLNQTIPAMKELGDPEKIRAVFWFDC